MQSVVFTRETEKERERDKDFSSTIPKCFFYLLLVNQLMHRHFATIHENHPIMTQTNGIQIRTGANIGNQCFERIKKSGNFWSKELEVKQKKTLRM